MDFLHQWSVTVSPSPYLLYKRDFNLRFTSFLFVIQNGQSWWWSWRLAPHPHQQIIPNHPFCSALVYASRSLTLYDLLHKLFYFEQCLFWLCLLFIRNWQNNLYTFDTQIPMLPYIYTIYTIVHLISKLSILFCLQHQLHSCFYLPPFDS